MATATESLNKAIQAKLEGDTGAGGVRMLTAGRIWYLRAKRASTLAYLVWFPAGLDHGSTFGNKSLDEWLIQFSSIAEKATDAITLHDRVKTLLEGATLTFSGSDYGSVMLRRANEPTPEMPTDDFGMWKFDVDFRVILQEV